ncbi:hypothetical protein ABIA95_008521 [Bradyrhizobium sp. LA8.1]|jgi:hypothetical protein
MDRLVTIVLNNWITGIEYRESKNPGLAASASNMN